MCAAHQQQHGPHDLSAHLQVQKKENRWEDGPGMDVAEPASVCAVDVGGGGNRAAGGERAAGDRGVGVDVGAAATAPPLVIELPVTFDSGVDVEDGVGDDRAVSHTETHAAANGNPVACRFETPRRAGIRAVKRQASI